MSLIAKLSLHRTEPSDVDYAAKSHQESSNTDDSKSSDDTPNLDAVIQEKTSELDSEKPSEQLSEFGQSANISNNSENEDIATEIFTRTKVLVTPDDPLVMMIQLVRQEFADARSDIKSFVFAEMMDNLGMHTAAVKDEIKAVHNDYAKIIIKHTETVKEATDQALSDFSREVEETVKILTTQLDEVKKTTKVLENQKQFIVNDVYGKLNEKILTEVKGELTAELKRIANNENNKVNQQKNMLIGAFGGLFIGMIFAVFIGSMI